MRQARPAGATGRPLRHRSTRRFRRRALGLTGAILVMGVVAGMAAFSLRPRPAASVTGQAPFSSDGSDIVEIHSAHGASFVPALAGRRPLFILALGSDARPGQAITRQRADSIHLIGVNRSRTRATVLGFPRDSWVSIPGRGTNKINSAMSSGGPELLIKTLERMTGVRIDFWMLTSFDGMKNMVDGIGGLQVPVPYRMDDPFSGAYFQPGVTHMTGKEALAFSRDRHDSLKGDIDRSLNQGRVLLSALAKLRVTFGQNPTQIFRWVVIGMRNLHTDLPLPTLLDLGLTATRVPLSSVNNIVVPATTGQVGAQSVVFIQSGARSIYADMRKDGVVG